MVIFYPLLSRSIKYVGNNCYVQLEDLFLITEDWIFNTQTTGGKNTQLLKKHFIHTKKNK